MTGFDSVVPKIAGLIKFVISLSSSVLDNKLFTFEWQKCKPRVLRGSHVLRLCHQKVEIKFDKILKNV